MALLAYILRPRRDIRMSGSVVTAVGQTYLTRIKRVLVVDMGVVAIAQPPRYS
jgi:hypothetical protein